MRPLSVLTVRSSPSSAFSFPPSQPPSSASQTTNPIFWEPAGALFLCQQISLGNISSAIKELTGRKLMDLSLSLGNETAGRIRRSKSARARDMPRAWLFMHSHGFALTERCHRLTNRIYITHFTFSLFFLEGSCNWIFPPLQLIRTISYSSLTWNEIHPAKLHSEGVGLAFRVALLLRGSE